MLSALERIRTLSEATARKLSSRASLSCPGMRPKVDDIKVVLSVPQTMQPQLVALGLDETSAERVSTVVLRAMHEFKSHCEADFTRRLQQAASHSALQDGKFAASLHTAFVTIYNQGLGSITSHVLQNLIPRITEARRMHTAQQSRSFSGGVRRAFNPNAVPTLERLFGRNPFPSRLEKLELASQYDMTYKQIKDWFQNHRNRSRKDGKGMPRPHCANSYLQEIEDQLVDAFLPAIEDACDSEDDLSRDRWNAPSTFDLKAPAHAYPTPYPPVCTYDPFPQDRHTFQLPWTRSPTSNDCHRVAMDIPDLVSAMSKLTLDDGPDGRFANHRPVWSTHHHHTASSCIGFFVRCPRAPLPALVSGLRAVTCDGQLPTPPRRTRSSRRQSRSAYRAVDNARVLSPIARPFKRSLPRRVPKHPCLSPCHEASPSYTSSRTPSTPGSSPQSNPDTPLSTPPWVPTSLPCIADTIEWPDSMFSLTDPVISTVFPSPLPKAMPPMLHALSLIGSA